MQKKKKNIIQSPPDSLKKTLPGKKRIVIVEDDPEMRNVFCLIFDEAGYDVELIGDGRQVLKNEFETPDLFLIDKLLSGVNGLDLCKHLKTQTQTANIPVIMISASPNIGPESRKAGADDYVEKPFDLQHLLKLIARNIRPISKQLQGY